MELEFFGKEGGGGGDRKKKEIDGLDIIRARRETGHNFNSNNQ